MYNHHFGLAEAPFSIAPDPRYLYLSEQHREALAHLAYGIGDHGGFVVLTGEVGTGKTTVCRCLLQQVPDHLDIAVIVNPKLDSHELLQTICEELGVGCAEDDPTSKQLLDALNQFLLATHARGRNAILIVDEAQNLAPDVLEQLRLLTNLETNERKLLQLILLGQPELNTMLAQPSLRQLAQRITARYHLRPLTRGEVAGYIQHRLAIAGGREHLFSEAATKAVYRYSKGIPRLVNLLCDRALLGVYAQSGNSVDVAMVRRAAAEVLPPAGIRQTVSMWRMAAIVGVAILGIGLAAAGVYLYREAASAIAVEGSSGDWLTTLEQVPAEKLPALHGLMSLWRVDAATIAATHDCASEDRWSCIALSSLGLDDLRNFNVPVVLELRRVDDSAPQFVVLKRLEGDSARIEFNRREWRVSWPDLASLWRGQVLMLVPAPAVAQLPLQAGASGDLVAWFDSQLYRYRHANDRRWQRTVHDGSDKIGEGVSKQAWLASHYLALREAPAKNQYDAELLAQVKQFQQTQGLPENGVIDLQSVFALSRVVDAALPSLMAAQKRDG